MAVINLKNCVIQLRGGTTGNKLQLKIGGGNMSYEEKRNREYIKDRGLLDTIRDGDDEPMMVKMVIEYEYITGPGQITTFSFEDALKQRGSASTWTTTSPDACEPYCVDIYFFNEQACGTLQQETLIFPEFRYESLSHDPKASTISCDGKCNVTQATATRGSVST